MCENIRSSSLVECGMTGMWWCSLKSASSEISEIHWLCLSRVHLLVATSWHLISGFIGTLLLLYSHTFLLTTHIHISAAWSKARSHVILIQISVGSKLLVWVRDVLVCGDARVLVDTLAHAEGLRSEWTLLDVLGSVRGHWSSAHLAVRKL